MCAVDDTQFCLDLLRFQPNIDGCALLGFFDGFTLWCKMQIGEPWWWVGLHCRDRGDAGSGLPAGIALSQRFCDRCVLWSSSPESGVWLASDWGFVRRDGRCERSGALRPVRGHAARVVSSRETDSYRLPRPYRRVPRRLSHAHGGRILRRSFRNGASVILDTWFSILFGLDKKFALADFGVSWHFCIMPVVHAGSFDLVSQQR